MAELKQCCEHTPVIEWRECGIWDPICFVKCPICGRRGEPYERKELAIDAWNKRS